MTKRKWTTQKSSMEGVRIHVSGEYTIERGWGDHEGWDGETVYQWGWRIHSGGVASRESFKTLAEAKSVIDDRDARSAANVEFFANLGKLKGPKFPAVTVDIAGLDAEAILGKVEVALWKAGVDWVDRREFGREIVRADYTEAADVAKRWVTVL